MTELPLQVLLIENDPGDAALMLRELRAAGLAIESQVVGQAEELAACVRARPWDIVLADRLDAFEALAAAGSTAPVILVSGALGDEAAVDCLHRGVADFVLKTRLVKLPEAVRRAVNNAAAQNALRRSEASKRAFIGMASLGIGRVDLNADRFLESNLALAQMLGYDEEAEVGRLLIAGDLSPDGLPFAGWLGGIGHSDVVHNAEARWKRKDGRLIQVRVNGRTVRNGQEGPEFEFIAEDITARRWAEDRLEQFTRLYAVLYRTSQAIVRLHEPQALFAEICRIAVEQGRFRMAWADEVDPVAGCVRPVCGEGDEKGFLEQIRIAVADEPAGRGPTGTALREQRHFVCKDIATDPAMLPWREQALQRGYRCSAAFPLLLHGSTAGVFTVYSSELGFFDEDNVALLDELAANVSFGLEHIEAQRQRQRAEEELNQFFQLSADLLAIAGFDGRFRRLNPAWQRVLDFPLEALAGRRALRWIHPEDRRAAVRGFAQLTAGEFSHRRFELRFRTHAGAWRWLLVTAAAAPDRRLVCAAATDITERKQNEQALARLEAQLRRQNEELERQNRRVQEANRMKGEFLANMSHELRSPLNGIIGFTQLMRDGKLGPVSPEHQEYLGDVLTSAHHLLELINDVLDLSKVDAGRIEFRPEPVDPAKVALEVAGVLSPLAAQKRIKLSVQVSPELATVYVDPARLRQVFYNYVSNALKFTAEDGQLWIRVLPEASSRFRIEVEDTGIGIPREQIPALFMEFRQLDSGAAKRFQGSGLGLALTRRLVQAQGGRVGVRSRLGEGSLFYAVLPRRCLPGPVKLPAVSTILVVEDEAGERNAIAWTLQAAGYAVDTAATTGEAIRKAAVNCYAAITLDLLLPDESGWEALRALRSTPNAGAPVIVLSAAGDRSASGVFPMIQASLRKPLAPEQLLEALVRAGVEPNPPGSPLFVNPATQSLGEIEYELRRQGYRTACERDLLLSCRRTPDGRQTPVVVWTGTDPDAADCEQIDRLAAQLAASG